MAASFFPCCGKRMCGGAGAGGGSKQKPTYSDISKALGQDEDEKKGGDDRGDPSKRWARVSPACRLTLLAGPEIRGKDKFNGGTKGADGRIYSIPANSPNVVVVDPATGTFETLKGCGPWSGRQKWLQWWRGASWTS